MNRPVNANYGVIRSVNKTRDKVKVSMPRGGIFECRNEGFEIGQIVCFILDALNRRIIKILPKEVADLQLMAGLNPELQEALQDKPIDSDAEIYEDIALIEEMTNAIRTSAVSKGHSFEELLDIVSGMDGEEPEGWINDNGPEYQE